MTHYAGIVVFVAPAATQRCARELDQVPGVEVHFSHHETGRIVVVNESRSAEEQRETLERLRALPGVLLAAPVYHYVDSSPDAEADAASER